MQLAVRLTEPVVFLRGDHSNPRRALQANNGADPSPPAMVRGLLVLTLDKPTKISTIEVELEGKCTSEWPEGMGARRVEVYEEHRILHAKATFFNAAEEEKERLRRPGSFAGSLTLPRRNASVGPGCALDRGGSHGEDFEGSEEEESGESDGTRRGRRRDRDVDDFRAGAFATLDGAGAPPPIERRNSVDPYRQSHYPEIPNYPSDNSGNYPPTWEELEQLRRDSETDANTRANAQSPIGSPLLRPQHPNSQPPPTPTPTSTPQNPLIFSRNQTPTLTLTPAQTRTYIHAHHSNPNSPRLPNLPPTPGTGVYGAQAFTFNVPESSSPLASPPINAGDLVGAGIRTSYFQDQGFPESPQATPPLHHRTSSNTLSQSHSHSHSPLASQLGSLGAPLTRPTSMSVLPSIESSSSPASSSSSSNGLPNGAGVPLARFQTNTNTNTNTNGTSEAKTQGTRSESKTRSRASLRFSLIPGLGLSLPSAKEKGKEKEKEKERGRDHTARYSDGTLSLSLSRTGTRTSGTGGDRDLEKKPKKKSTFEKIGERLKAGVVGVGVGVGGSQADGGGANGVEGGGSGFGSGFGSGHAKHWKEFKKGTHTYPLSFVLPSTLPPSNRLPHCSTVYKIKASVHRPGAFTPRLKSSREVFLVSCPVEFEGDEEALAADGVGVGAGANGPGPGQQGGPPPPFGDADAPGGVNGTGAMEGGGGGAINVEREWEDCLRYRIEFGRRKIEMGGWMDMRIMLMPMDKIRIWRIGVYLEEKIDYLSNFKKVVSREAPHYHELWSVRAHKVEHNLLHTTHPTTREKEKERYVEVPLIPITSDSPDALFNSPLLANILSSSYAPIPHHDLHRSASHNQLNGNGARQNLLGPGPNQDHFREREREREEEEEIDEEEGLEALPTLLGPGPYHIGQRIRIPTCDRVHATYLNAAEQHHHHETDNSNTNTTTWVKANAEVRHSIKVILRVEKVGANAPPPGEGGQTKRKKWDIVVQVGVGVLSCHCARKWTSLPSYSYSVTPCGAAPISSSAIRRFEISCPCERDRRTRPNAYAYTSSGPGLGPSSAPFSALHSRRASVEFTDALEGLNMNGSGASSGPGGRGAGAGQVGAMIQNEAARYEFFSAGGGGVRDGPPAYEDIA